MKKMLAIFIVACFLFTMVGCGNNKTIEGIEYGTYGLLNADDKKNPNIEYRVIWGNIIVAAILVETIVVPIYVFGFDLFEPVGKKSTIRGRVVR